MLSDDTLLELIHRGESDRVEFTESTTDMDKVRQAICAFANDLPDHRQPGVFFIGLKDDGSSAGLTIDDRLLQTLGGLRNDGKILPFPAMEVDKRTLHGIDVAVIQVEPSDNPPVKVDGRCWIRVGPRRAQATAGEERRLTEKNPTLAEAMKTLGFMQRFGIGVQTARNALATNGNPPPEFDIQDTFFCVTIHQQNEPP